MSDTIDQVLRRTSALINQPDGRNFSDPELKEFINMAQQSVALRLAERGVTEVRAEVDVTVPAGETAITAYADSNPPSGVPSTTLVLLPSDFISPIRLWEYHDGVWTQMIQVRDSLPINAVPSGKLIWWDWRDDAIRFSPATDDVLIRVHYNARLEQFTMPRETIPLPDLVNVLSFWAASIAATASAPEKVQFFQAQAESELSSIFNIDIHANQSRPVRRKRRRFGIPRWRY